MSLFTRIINFFKGALSLFVSDIEKSRPEVAYENAINAAIAKFDKARNAVANIIANRQNAENRLKKAVAEKAQIDADLEAALATNNEQLGTILIQKQEQV